MRRISDRTVELDDDEAQALDYYNDCLDEGQGVIEAATNTENLFSDRHLDPAFYAYLRDEDPR